MKYKAGQVYMTKFMKKEIMLATINADDFDEKDARILSEAKSYDGYFELRRLDDTPCVSGFFSTDEEISSAHMHDPPIKTFVFKKRRMAIDVWECVRADG